MHPNVPSKAAAARPAPWQAWRAIATLLAAAAMLLASLVPATGQNGSVPVIRDAEAEALVRDYVRPLLQAAGLGGDSVDVVIVNAPSFNAFVADGRRIFVNAGTLMESLTPNELIGVLAHETGHLAGGHLARLREAVRRSAWIAGLGLILGGVAAVASGEPGAAAGIAFGGLSAANRSLLSYQRGEELTADSAALSLLRATGQSPRGMITVFERLANEQMFAVQYADPFAQSHPFASDRLQQIQASALESPYYDRLDPAELQARHDLVRAKFIGFTQPLQAITIAYPPSDTSLPAAYARAVAAFRFSPPGAAVAAADALIAAAPSNPYFWELKGQILLETGNAAASIEPLRRAVQLAPSRGLIAVLLGHALVATDDPAVLGEAVTVLNRGLSAEPQHWVGWRQLAIAYARQGDIPMADLATAQGYFTGGGLVQAQVYAERAQAGLATGTPAWLRAEDIRLYVQPQP